MFIERIYSIFSAVHPFHSVIYLFHTVKQINKSKKHRTNQRITKKLSL